MAISFGAEEPYAEPYWYSASASSPYYTEGHRRFRAKVRSFVDAEIRPNVLRWEKEQVLPLELLAKAARAGVYAPQWPAELGGTPPDGVEGSFDAFHDLIWVDELSRCASQSVILLFTIYTMALPPVLSLGTEEQVRRVVPAVLAGEACISLCISEPSAGSDVARLQATASRTADGGWLVNGVKKWITAGCYSTFFVVACRTGGEGAGGLSLLLLERGMEGLETRKLPLQGGRAAGTAMLTLDNVAAPGESLLPRRCSCDDTRASATEGGSLCLVPTAGHEPDTALTLPILPCSECAAWSRGAGLPIDHVQLQPRTLVHRCAGTALLKGLHRRSDSVRPTAEDLRGATDAAPGDPPQGRRDGDEGRRVAGTL